MPMLPGGCPGTLCLRLQFQVIFAFFSLCRVQQCRGRVSLVRQIGFFLSVFWKSKRREGEVDQKCAQEICPIFHPCQTPSTPPPPPVPHSTRDIKVSGGDLNLITQARLSRPPLTTIPQSPTYPSSYSIYQTPQLKLRNGNSNLICPSAAIRTPPLPTNLWGIPSNIKHLIHPFSHRHKQKNDNFRAETEPRSVLVNVL